MGGLNDWLSNIIPNELKGNLGTIAAAAGAAYFGYQGLKYGYPKVQSFIGETSKDVFSLGQGYKTEGKGMLGFMQKHKDSPLVKFGKGMVGTTIGKKGKETKAENDMYLANMRALETRYTSNKFSGSPIAAGQFQATRVQSAGFSNNRVQESLSSMAAYMADLQDNGRIDSSALYAEGPKGTTIKIGSSKLASLKQV